MKEKILVWDLPTRIFHWTFAVSFAGAFLTAESERWRDIHVMLGYTALGLVAFRLCWGLVGTRYARFAEFIRGREALVRYLKSLMTSQPEHYLGHNPAGALAIVGLLGLAVVVGATGWLVYADIGGDAFEELHEVIAYAMLVLVGVHIAGVVVSSVLHRENLARAMINGYKEGALADAISSSKATVGAVLAATVAAFWLWSVTADSTATPDAGASTEQAGQVGKKSDDD